MDNWGRVAVFDLETTGVDVETSRIVSACVAVLDGAGELIARWDWLADPGIEIPAGAAAVHGITTERARMLGRPANLVIAEIAQTLRVQFALGTPVVVYNAPYDLTLLDRECRRHGLGPMDVTAPVIDPLVLDKAVDRYRKGKRTLAVTAALYGVTLDDAHDAGSDAIAAGRVAQALARAYPAELDVAVAELHDLQRTWYAEQAASFQDYIRTVKGDDAYVADSAWPIRPLDDPSAFVDTQPIAAPEPRPSLTVPTFDLYGTGVLAIAQSVDAPLFESEPIEQALESEPLEPEPVEPEPLEPEPFAASPHEPSLLEPEAYVPEFAFEPEPGEAEPFEPEPFEPEPFESEPMLASEPLIDEAAAEPVSVDVPVSGFSFDPASVPVRPTRPAVLRVAAGIITDPAGRTLVVRKRGTSAFMQAGGKIEPGESALDALSRELREELGLDLDIDATEFLGSFRAVAANEPDTVIRAEVFALSTLGTSAELAAVGEIEEILWLDGPEADGVELAPLTRDTILPLWLARRSALF